MEPTEMGERFNNEVLQKVLDAASEPEPFEAMRAVLEKHRVEHERATLVATNPWTAEVDRGEDTPMPQCFHCGAVSWSEDVSKHAPHCKWRLAFTGASDGSPR